MNVTDRENTVMGQANDLSAFAIVCDDGIVTVQGEIDTLTESVETLTESVETLTESVETLTESVESLPNVAFKTVSDGEASFSAAAKDDTLTVEGSGVVDVNAVAASKKLTIGLSLGESYYGGNYLALQQDYVPYLKNTLMSDSGYRFYVVEFNSSSLGARFNNLPHPVTVFIIMVKTVGWNPTLSSYITWSDWGMEVAQNTSQTLLAGHNYRLTICKTKDSSNNGSVKKIVFIEDITN